MTKTTSKKKTVTKSVFTSKAITALVNPAPLPKDIIDLAKKFSSQKRRCEVCPTILSSYNKTKRCSVHQVTKDYEGV